MGQVEMSVGPAGTRLRYGDALAVGELRALLLAQFASVAAFSVSAVALTLLVYRRSASPLLASLTFALAFLPYLLGGTLLSGAIDRVSPRVMSARSDAASAALIGVMAWRGLPLPLLFAMLFASGTLASLSGGARAALARTCVPETAYVPARSLLRIAAQVAQLAGNGLGGTLLALAGASGALLTAAALLVASALAVLLGLRDGGARVPEPVEPLLRDSLRGAREILRLTDVRRLLLFNWLTAMVFVAPEAVAAPYVAHHHAGPANVGWWLLALPVGLIAGDIGGVRLLTAERQQRAVAPVAALGFVPFLAFVADPGIAPAIGLLVLSGVCGLAALGLDARLRAVTPEPLFARTMTIATGGLMSIQGLGFAIAGGIAQLTSPATAIVVAGVAGLTVVLGLLGRELRPGS